MSAHWCGAARDLCNTTYYEHAFGALAVDLQCAEFCCADVKPDVGAPVRRCSGSDSTMTMLKSKERMCCSTLTVFTDQVPQMCYKTRRRYVFVTAGCPKSCLSCNFPRLTRLSRSVEADSLDWVDSVDLSEQEVVSLGADTQ